MLWIVMEEVCPKLLAAYVALFSETSPTIGWVKRLVARGLLVEMQLVRAFLPMIPSLQGIFTIR